MRLLLAITVATCRRPMMQYMSDAHWSTTRPGVMYVAKMDGSLDVWDFLFLAKKPTLNVTASIHRADTPRRVRYALTAQIHTGAGGGGGEAHPQIVASAQNLAALLTHCSRLIFRKKQ